MFRLMLFPSLFFLTFLSLASVSSSCKKAKFKGDSGKKNSEKGENDEDDKKKNHQKACESKAREDVKGIKVAFLLDRSTSNNTTDCPKTQDRHPCGQTNRETAVLGAFDSLENYKKTYNPFSSEVATVMFPTPQDPNSGWGMGQNWLTVQPEHKQTLATSLMPLRYSNGNTPYLAALEGGKALFSDAAATDLEKIAVLVTDGEPTDADALRVKAAGEELKKMGVKIFVVFVTNDKSRQERTDHHVDFLKKNGHSDANIDELIGRNGKQSVIDAIATEKLDVANAQGLENKIAAVIQKSVECK